MDAGYELLPEQRTAIRLQVARDIYREECARLRREPLNEEAQRDNWLKVRADDAGDIPPTDEEFAEYLAGCWMGQEYVVEFGNRLAKAYERAEFLLSEIARYREMADDTAAQLQKLMGR